MSNSIEVLVPDIGNFDSVDVIELLVKVGDTIAKEDSLITVESDKASMDIPASQAGVVKEVKVKVGDKIAKGSLILLLDVEASVEASVETSVVAASPLPLPHEGRGTKPTPTNSSPLMGEAMVEKVTPKFNPSGANNINTAVVV
jgi:dihydrolipoamide dehydrogenase